MASDIKQIYYQRLILPDVSSQFLSHEWKSLSTTTHLPPSMFPPGRLLCVYDFKGVYIRYMFMSFSTLFWCCMCSMSLSFISFLVNSEPGQDTHVA